MTEIYLNDVMQFAKSLNARVARERQVESKRFSWKIMDVRSGMSRVKCYTAVWNKANALSLFSLAHDCSLVLCIEIEKIQ